jgi:hydrogenase-4 component B
MLSTSFMTILLLSLGLFLGGSLLPLFVWRHNCLARLIGAVGCIAGTLSGLAASLPLLLGSGTALFSAPWATAGVRFAIRLDPLAAFFLAPVLLITGIAAIYSIGYLKMPDRGLQAARHWSAYNLLAFSMVMVIAADNSLVFLIAWELMSLSSFLLIGYELTDEQVRRAGWTYLVATHLGTVFLFCLFLGEYRLSGSLDFAVMSTWGTLPETFAVLFFLLALVGFGTKAGLFPLHVWLPEAHAAAPSHVSALMSGVMIKTAVYAFLRLVSFLSPLPAWCGLLVMMLGICGALFGVALAALQSDVKRSLAFSTVENIGIIFIALGVWLYGRSAGLATVASLALAGGLLHIWNHALFKGLLFMGAGSLIHSGGTRELSAMGGLLRRMPVTGGLMVVGGCAITALPPLNGLISELLIYLGILQAGQATTGAITFAFMLLLILLATVGCMVLLVMARIIGIALCGEPRSTASFEAQEAPSLMLWSMAVAALFCLIFGIFPQVLVRLVQAPLSTIVADTAAFGDAAKSLPFGKVWSITAITLLGLLTLILRNRFPGRKADKSTWGCGFIHSTSRLAYTAGGFSQFAEDGFFLSSLRTTGGFPSKGSLFPATMRHVRQSLDPIFLRFFTPLFVKGAEFANACRRLQAGQIGIYMTYFFLATILLAGWAIFSSQG